MCVSFKQPLDSLRLLLAVLQLVALLFEESVIKSQIIFFFFCRIFRQTGEVFNHSFHPKIKMITKLAVFCCLIVIFIEIEGKIEKFQSKNRN